MTKGLNKLHVGLAVSILLFFALGYWLAKPKLPDLPPYLSFSADVDGTKAWKELLATKQSAVKEWRLDWKHLPGGTSMLLVAIQPSAVTKSDREHLLKWVQAGNDAIIFDREPQGWASWETVRVDGGPQDARGALGELEQLGKQEQQVKAVSTIRVSADYASADETLTGKVETSYRLQPGGSGLALFEDERGVLASRVQEGAGSITMVLTPTWLQNGTIDEASHFELIWPLFAKSWDAVWVDETHHGYGTKPGLLAVYPAWLVLASAQLGLALLLWLWLRGKRFGPVHTPRAWT
ncbi:DUF4350 domain-containing protein, partial [Paenibacillus chondroitinus]